MLIIDIKDSPIGYYPVLKDSVLPSNMSLAPKSMNSCNYCDWRKDCSSIVSCMSYKRLDECSVVFKKI